MNFEFQTQEAAQFSIDFVNPFMANTLIPYALRCLEVKNELLQVRELCKNFAKSNEDNSIASAELEGMGLALEEWLAYASATSDALPLLHASATLSHLNPELQTQEAKMFMENVIIPFTQDVMIPNGLRCTEVKDKFLEMIGYCKGVAKIKKDADDYGKMVMEEFAFFVELFEDWLEYANSREISTQA